MTRRKTRISARRAQQGVCAQQDTHVEPANINRSDAHLNALASKVLLTRWLLLPFYLGLVPVLITYAGRFFAKVKDFAVKGSSLTDDDLLLGVLHLVDIVMVANLIVMIVIGGFASFIRRFNLTDEHSRLRWLNHVDTIALKLKMGLSLIGVSSIQLLELFVESNHTESMVIVRAVSIHMVFVISTVAIAWVAQHHGSR